MKIEIRAIESVVPYARNPRKNDAAVAAVAASIKEFGFKVPIIVDRDGVIIAGHTRVKAAERLGLDGVPVIVADDLTPEQARALRLVDNKTAELAEWDDEMLSLEIANIELDLAPFGFDVGIEAGAGETEEDEYSIPGDLTTSVKVGDVIQLGNHRLYCGDSTDGEAVAAFMGGKRALLMATDPPYGVAYTDKTRVAAERAHGRPQRVPKWAGGIENDELLDDNIQPFLEKAFRVAADIALESKAAWYLWHAHLTAAFFAAAAAAADVLLHRQIIWAKPALLFGFGDYHWQHECCFYGWRKGYRPEFYGPRNQTTLWHIKHEASNSQRVHPTQKPIELFAIPMRNHTKLGDLVYEPFAGSGSQIMAAEQLGRICYAIEIDPRFCQVIIDRYARHCERWGRACECKVNGEPYSV